MRSGGRLPDLSFSLLLGGGDRPNVLLEPFQGKLELLRIHSLGLAAVPGADQLLIASCSFSSSAFRISRSFSSVAYRALNSS